MENDSNDLTGQLVKPSKQQIIYMMPQHELEGDSIDLWQFFLPLVKYKVQILLFLLVGGFLGIFIPLYFGKTEYTSRIIYQTDKNFSNKTLYVPDEFQNYLKSQNVLEIHSNLAKFTQGSISGETIDFSISTDDPKKTFNISKNLNTYFLNKIEKKVLAIIQVEIDKLSREKLFLSESLISSIEHAKNIHYEKNGGTAVFFEKDSELLYISETLPTQVRAKKIPIVGNPREFAQRKIGKTDRSVMSFSLLNDRLKERYQELQEQEQQLFLEITRKDSNILLLSLIEQRKNSNSLSNHTIESYTDLLTRIENEMSRLSSVIGDISIKKNQVKMVTKLATEEYENIAYIIRTTEEAEQNKWIDISSIGFGIPESSANSTIIFGANASGNADKKAKSLFEINSYETRLKVINDEIKKRLITKNIIERSDISPLSAKSDFNNIERKFILSITDKSYNYNPNLDEEPQTELKPSFDLEPIRFSKQIFMICVLIALGVAVVSVFVRVLLLGVRSSSQFKARKQDFVEALKFWKI
jgi:hypothetical protein